MSRPARLKKALANRAKRRSQQFGQTNDSRTRNGATGCTDTVLQWLAWLWLGKWYTHNQIRSIAGVPGTPNRGLRPTEVQRFCDKVGLPYEIRTDISFDDVVTLSKRGPVGFGMSYSYYPEWQGFVYRGRRADGKPNGFAKPLKAAGRTQLSGFNPPDPHFGVLFGRNPNSGNCFVWEPNHGSSARPEKPDWDYCTTAQARHTFESYDKVLGRSSYALIPTRNLPL